MAIEHVKLLAYLGNAAVMAVALALAVAAIERWLAAAPSAGRATLYTAVLLATGLLPAVNLWAPSALPPAAMLVDVSTAVTSGATAGAGIRSSPWAIGGGLAVLLTAVRAAWLIWGLYGLRVLRRNSWATAEAAIRHSRQVSTPVTFGVLSPMILVPEQWAQMPDAVRRAVLAHEEAHIVRHDFFWNLMVEVVTLGLWWHPAVIWLKRRLTLARECSCDERAAAQVPGAAMLDQWWPRQRRCPTTPSGCWRPRPN